MEIGLTLMRDPLLPEPTPEVKNRLLDGLAGYLDAKAEFQSVATAVVPRSLPADLQRVADAWPGLPVVMRDAIVRLTETFDLPRPADG